MILFWEGGILLGGGGVMVKVKGLWGQGLRVTRSPEHLTKLPRAWCVVVSVCLGFRVLRFRETSM